MAVEPVNNPFTLVYGALWDLAMRHRDLSANVKEGNRIRYDSIDDRSPNKGNVSASDLPELVLVVRSLTANLNNTSSTSQCTREYAWQLSGGDYRYSQLLAPIEWGIFCAMSGWRTTLVNLRWRDKGFVKRAQLLGGPTGLMDPQNNRNIIGWSTVWAVQVEMDFSQDDLESEIGVRQES